MEFTELNLHPDLQRGIIEADYVTCTPVQEQVLVSAFGGQDLYVQSQTGTGKTAAYLIVIFQRLLNEPVLHGKKALIMAPTRELAVQIEEEAKVLSQYLPFKTGSFYGGVGYGSQQKLLRDNVQILVGTPGRVLDLNQSGQMNLMDIAFLVLDEADRMFDMGFYPDLRKLIKVVPPVDHRQTMLFSATLNAWVKNLAWEYTKTPFEIEIEPDTVTVDEAEQMLYHVPSDDKMKLLMGIMRQEQPESAIIFCNTKRYAEVVAKRLRINGFECEFLIGDLPQVRRSKIIDEVKAGKVRYLVATDVAARGLDVQGLSLVVNYDIPSEVENYVHRIGRTARAGKTGKAITLASEQDVYLLPAIERYIGKPIPSEVVGAERYGEDQSAGLHVRSDFYAERSSHDAREHGRRSEDRSRSAKERGAPEGERRVPDKRPPEEASRSAERRIAEKARRTNPRNGPDRRETTGKAGRRAHTTDVSAAAPVVEALAPELTQLSFNERMAYYRQKYARDSRSRPVDLDKKQRRGKKPPDQTDAPPVSTAEQYEADARPQPQRPAQRTESPAQASSEALQRTHTPEAATPRPAQRTESPAQASSEALQRAYTPEAATTRPAQRAESPAQASSEALQRTHTPEAATPRPAQRTDSPDGATETPQTIQHRGILSRILSLLKKE
ncbi:MAG: DEAD/DEAH box helicase [Treponema sp.]|jgi:ATP-dependent RNA helicase RhlB|nr:DEAD/DEAH box helicase [Treponema sp.]